MPLLGITPVLANPSSGVAFLLKGCARARGVISAGRLGQSSSKASRDRAVTFLTRRALMARLPFVQFTCRWTDSRLTRREEKKKKKKKKKKEKINSLSEISESSSSWVRSWLFSSVSAEKLELGETQRASDSV
jgi:hypothetical protein